jgi:EAL domain-containing protein (putative c-di-GMP-specific phosphodiesterase class I)
MEGVLRDPIAGDGFDVAVTATAGAAVTGVMPLTAGQLLRQADLAMHHAKRTGLDVAVYEPDLGSQAREHLDVERSLRLAMDRGELLLHYQPLVDVGSGQIVGTEALVRWSHPERGLLSPAAFLPVAERTGQIVELGGITLHLACRQIARWGARDLRVPVSVNVAVEQLRRGDLPSLVAQELAGSSIDPRLLCLELTESSFLQNVTSDLDQLAELRAMGVHLAIDDFGTGYSSLAYVQNLPVDRLKIDISFVRRIARDQRARHLVNAIIGMAEALQLDVVAEGVEREDQREVLAQLGCRGAQGFLFGRPMSPGDFMELLQASVLVPAARQPA